MIRTCGRWEILTSHKLATLTKLDSTQKIPNDKVKGDRYL